MQQAQVMLALGGDKGNTIPKTVTAAEVPVLQAIHGNDAVFDIRPIGEVKRSNRDERARLLETYGKMQDGKDVSPVSQLYPGAAARVFERFDELSIPAEFYAAEKRVAPIVTAQAEDAPSSDGGPDEYDGVEEPDGIGDMPDKIFD